MLESMPTPKISVLGVVILAVMCAAAVALIILQKTRGPVARSPQSSLTRPGAQGIFLTTFDGKKFHARLMGVADDNVWLEDGEKPIQIRFDAFTPDSRKRVLEALHR